MDPAAAPAWFEPTADPTGTAPPSVALETSLADRLDASGSVGQRVGTEAAAFDAESEVREAEAAAGVKETCVLPIREGNSVITLVPPGSGARNGRGALSPAQITVPSLV
jgi:hypothetical protein